MSLFLGHPYKGATYHHHPPTSKEHKMKRTIILIILLIMFFTGYSCKSEENSSLCPTDEKVCPDGVTYLIRNPNNNCEFDPCPQDFSTKDDHKNIHTGYDVRRTNLEEVSQAQIDFLNSNYDYLRVFRPIQEFREVIDIPIFLYRTIAGAGTLDSGYTDTWIDGDYMNMHEDMFLHSAVSSRADKRFENPFGRWATNVCDFGESAKEGVDHWVNYYTSRAVEDIYSVNYDGLFIDSAEHELDSKWPIPEMESLVENYSNEDWVICLRNAFAHIKAKMPDKTVIFNGLHRGSADAVESLEYVDGGFHEEFLYSWYRGNEEGYFGKQNWISIIETIEKVKESKIIRLLSSPRGSKLDDIIKTRMFILGSYLLVSNENVYISFNDHDLKDQEEWFDGIPRLPEFDIRLGKPLGAYYEKDDIYIREFEDGLVIVNPDERATYNYHLDNTCYKVIPEGVNVVDKNGSISGGSLEYEPISGTIEVKPVSGLIVLRTIEVKPVGGLIVLKNMGT